MKTNEPSNWRPNYPAYNSPEGWEFEKKLSYKVLKLKLRFMRIERLIAKAEQLFKAAFAAKDTAMMCRYNLITIRLYEASNTIATSLVFDFKDTVPNYE